MPGISFLLRSLARRFAASPGVAAALLLWPLAACQEDAVGPPSGAGFLARLEIAPVISSLSGTLAGEVDSVHIAIRDADGRIIGQGGAEFPEGQDSVVIVITVTLRAAQESVTARIELLVDGQVRFVQEAPIVARVGAVRGGAQSVNISPATWDSIPIALGQGIAERAGAAAAYDTARHVVVVFGGTTATQLLGETWEYDGTSWSEVRPEAADAAPSRRVGHALVYDAARRRVVLFGGNDSTGTFNDTWEYDGTAWRRIATAASPPARAFHSMAYDAIRGRVVIFGGHSGGAFLRDTWEYDGTSWTQRLSVQRPSARAAHQMVFASNPGEIVLYGGFDGSNALSDTWVLEPTGWRQVVTAGSPGPRAAFGMSFDPIARGVLLFGGADDVRRFGDTWRYDPADSTWTLADADTLPGRRVLTAMAFDAARRVTVLVAGLSPNAVESDTWEWNGLDWRLSGFTGAPAPRTEHAMAFDARRGRVVLFGGLGAALFRDHWEFDRTSWREARLGVRPAARRGHAMAYDAGRGVVVMFGGLGAGGAPLADTWEYDGRAWRPVTGTGSVPGARSGHAMAYDSSRRKVVLFGGLGAGGVRLAETWEYDGTSWQQRSVSGPAARSGHGLAYDASRARLVLFGGRGASGDLADTWELGSASGATWVQVSTSRAPSARSAVAMAFAAGARADGGRTVVFGGSASGTLRDDAWAFDGSNWAELSPVRRPAARSSHAMVFASSSGGAALTAVASASRAIVMFGGSGTGGTVRGDTWVLR